MCSSLKKKKQQNSALTLMRKLEKICWGGETVWNNFFGELRNRLLPALLSAGWENICRLFFKSSSLVALMFKCSFPIFCPGHHIFRVPLNSDTSGLRQASFIYFHSALAEPCQRLVWARARFAGSEPASAEHLHIRPASVPPHSAGGSAPHPAVLAFQGNFPP